MSDEPTVPADLIDIQRRIDALIAENRAAGLAQPSGMDIVEGRAAITPEQRAESDRIWDELRAAVVEKGRHAWWSEAGPRPAADRRLLDAARA